MFKLFQIEIKVFISVTHFLTALVFNDASTRRKQAGKQLETYV